jgi:predicted transcriptional regulator
VDKNNIILEALRLLDLTTPEAKVYLELLRKPGTHAQISHATSINRTNVYRLVQELEKRGLVVRRTTDQGKLLTAADPRNLEAILITQEERVNQQRTAFHQVLPTLEEITSGGTTDFTVHTYEGVEGFKQMLWHELKTKDECLCMGYGSLEDLVPNRRWTERHRQLTIDAAYQVREIVNPAHVPEHYTDNTGFIAHYTQRQVPRSILPINQLSAIYNDTVATYGLKNGRRVGVEITCKTYAETLRHMYEQFWQLALPANHD